MSRKVEVHSHIEKHEAKDELKALIDKKMGLKYARPVDHRFWSAESYGLERCKEYSLLSADQKDALLEKSAFNRLHEAYHIERSGMAFTAKMTLLSGTIEQRKIYSQFSADESRHLHGVEGFLSQVPQERMPFILFLNDVIDHGSKQSLIFVIQVLLEGWGLEHYKSMTRFCQNKELESLLEYIIRDEAAHHGSGLLLFDQKQMSVKEKDETLDILAHFLGMVQIGPFQLLSDFSSVNKGFNEQKSASLLHDLKSEETTQNKLLLLKRLMSKAGASEFVEHLEKRHCFESYSHEQMLQYFKKSAGF